MFCPECRRYWNTPQLNAELGEQNPQKSRSSGPKKCAICGTLLARDRMVAEFPPSEHFGQLGRVRDKSMTISDVLRETSGPAGARANNNTQHGEVPLDERGRGGFSFPVNIRLPFRRLIPSNTEDGILQNKLAALDIILGIGALGAIILLVVTVTANSLFSEKADAKLPGVATVVASVKPKPTAIPAKPVTIAPVEKSVSEILPLKIGQSWSRLEPLTAVASEAVSGLPVSHATYKNQASLVHIWAERAKTEADAARIISSMQKNPQALVAAIGQSAVLTRQGLVNKAKCIYFDARKTESYDAAIGVIPGLLVSPHQLIYQSGKDVITIASSNAESRDQFASSYVSHIE